MRTWQERSARSEFLDALETLGTARAYEIVEIGRHSIWCDERDSCNHLAEAAVIGQTYRGEETLEQTYCRGLINCLIHEGRVRRSYVEIGVTPCRDSERTRNNLALRRSLRDSELTAEVWERGEGDPHADGWVTWSAPLEVFTLAGQPTQKAGPLRLQPGGAFLEVGYTLPSRTLGHLATHGAVMRWPYGSQRLWIVAAVDPAGMRAAPHPLYMDYKQRL